MKKKNITRSKMSQSELARRLGITRQLVAAHQKKGDAPPLDDVEAWELHIAVNAREGGALANATPETKAEFLKLKMRLMEAQARRIEIETLAREEKLIDFEGTTRFWGKAMSLFWGELERIKQQLPIDLPCKDHFERVAVYQAVEKQIGIVRSVVQNHIAQWEASKGKQ